MAYRPEARRLAQLWTMRNNFPMRAPDSAAKEPAALSDELADRLDRIAKSLPPGTTTRPPGTGTNKGTTFIHVSLWIECAAATMRAASYGPLTASWRLAAYAFGGFATPANTYVALTSTPDAPSGLQTAPSGSDLVRAVNSLGVSASPTPPLFPQGNVALGSALIMAERGSWQSPGLYVTGWLDNRLGGTTVMQNFLLSIELAQGQEITTGPDLSVLRARPRVYPPPPPRYAPPSTPASVRITSGGFSRIIPWDFLDPAIKQEYLVNLANGKPTIGLEPL